MNSKHKALKSLYPKHYDVKKGSATFRQKMREAYKKDSDTSPLPPRNERSIISKLKIMDSMNESKKQ